MLGDFDYVRAGSVEEACALLAENEGARILAGGTDLLVNVRNRIISPALLVDIKGIPELGELSLEDGMRIGAAVPLNVVAENKKIREIYPALAEAAGAVGSYQVRNRATLAGNLGNASPAADTAPPLFVLNAQVEIAGAGGTRTLPVCDLLVGVKRTSLDRGEMITAIVLPPTRGARSAFLKKQRIKGHDLAVVNMAGFYDPSTGKLRVAIGSCAVTPVLLPSLPEPVRGDDPLDEVVAELDRIAQEAVRPIDDLRGSAEYRRAMITVYLRRLMEALLERKPDGA